MAKRFDRETIRMALARSPIAHEIEEQIVADLIRLAEWERIGPVLVACIPPRPNHGTLCSCLLCTSREPNQEAVAAARKLLGE